MTREEAIQELQDYKGLIQQDGQDYIYLDERDIPLIDMAIEALSEGNIARDISTIIENEQDMRVMLQNADRPKGEWKCMADCGVTECDQCGWIVEEYVGDYNFCPNCGARLYKGGGNK